MTTTESLAALADRYGVRVEAIREVAGGVANRTYFLGDELFLRIPRTTAFERDLRKEVAVIPAARGGIPKPPRPNERHWTAPPASRLLGVLRFFAAGPPEPWSRLA